MADLVYRTVMHDVKEKIKANAYPSMKLPDERTLAQQYQVSRSSLKKALALLAEQGIIFKKRGSGTFINPLYLKNQSLFKYEGSNLGITDSFHVPGKKQSIKPLDYQVVTPDEDLRQDLFLEEGSFVYQIKRLRLLDGKPFLLETGFIPIKILPELKPQVLQGSLFNYLQDAWGKSVTRSYLTITVSPSTADDQKMLELTPTEPVGVMSGIFFLDDGTPFEVSNMRVHYKYMKYNTFVDLH
ncbi:MAG: GntR family transcriptional regulator [Lactobacillus sp.]|jgi:DNA-binding GntR family transcriptional regulator|nr:GntR family transcriptional regulator [Lactobacillus sp.]MCI1481689.1 GntR family transcriptional regulator [Lactobacillus sp.]